MHSSTTMVLPLQNMMSRVAHDIVLNKPLTLRKIVALKAIGSKLSLMQMRSLNSTTLQKHYNVKPACNETMEHFEILPIHNEPVQQYEAGSAERKKLEKELEKLLAKVERVPISIGSELKYEKPQRKQPIPFNFGSSVAVYSHASRVSIRKAMDLAVDIQENWDQVKLCERMEIWERAAFLISTKYRYKIIAAIMLGQAKTVRQAELDVAELIDFLRINPLFLREVANYEPINETPAMHRNYMRLRGLPGFVAAISPFNYTSIAANLAFTPALMGNAVLWKPSDSSILSNWYVYQAMRDAGLPEGVVNFIPACETTFSSLVIQHQNLAGINFTGSAGVLKVLWQLVAQHIDTYENYPRLIGECGGKNFHFVHPSADPDEVVACTIRSAFEYAGQKCSSCSMLYVPKSMWESKIKPKLLDIASKLFVSDAIFCDCFYSAVINKRAFERIYQYFKYIKQNTNCKVLIGGTCCKDRGYFVEPTIIEIKNLNDRLCKEELMAPILCVHVYEDSQIADTMRDVAQVNHGLTGSVFARDNEFVKQACQAFRSNVGNLSINDKCTGARVAQQPFGGGHLTGTNDKIGSPHYLLRWTSPQVIKESFKPHVNVYYPYMEVTETMERLRTAVKEEGKDEQQKE